MVQGIDHIELIVQDVEAFVAMFKQLGFRLLARTMHHGESAELQLPGEGQPTIEIHRVSGEENPGVNHIAFRVDDVRAAHRELGTAGIEFDGPPELIPQTGRLIANFRDPDGWRLQLVDANRQEWTDGEGSASH